MNYSEWEMELSTEQIGKYSFPISIIVIFLSRTFRQLVTFCAHTIHPKKTKTKLNDGDKNRT